MAPVALSATGQSNILFPAPSNYLRHADFILLETTSSFKLQVPKKAEHLLGFPPAAAPAAVAEAAEPFGRALDRSEVLAGTPPQRGQGWNPGSILLWNISFLAGKRIISQTRQLFSSQRKAFSVLIIWGLGLGEDPI